MKFKILCVFATALAASLALPAFAQNDAPDTGTAVTSWDKEAFDLVAKYGAEKDYIIKLRLLYEISLLQNKITFKEKLIDAYSSFASEKDAPMWLKEAALLLKQRLLNSSGRTDERLKTLAQLGYANVGYIVGPFENQNNSGFDNEFAPEKGFDPEAAMEGVYREVFWRKLPDQAAKVGWLAFDDLLYPADQTVVYYAIGLKTDKPATARMALNFSQSARVYINGALAFEFAGKTEAKFTDVVYLSVELKPGVNPILIKLGCDNGTAGMSLRFTELNSVEPPKGVEFVSDAALLKEAFAKTPVSPDNVSSAKKLAGPVEDAEKAFEKLSEEMKKELGEDEPVKKTDEEKNSPNKTMKEKGKIKEKKKKTDLEIAKIKEKYEKMTSQANLTRAIIYYLAGLYDANERKVEEFIDAAIYAVQSPTVEMYLWRHLTSPDPKTRIEALEAAYAKEPNNPKTALPLSRALFSEGFQLKSIKILKDALAKNPDDLDLALEYYERLSSFGDPLMELASLKQLQLKYEGNPYLMEELLKAYEKAGHETLAFDMRNKLAKIEIGSGNLWAIFDAYIDRRDVDKALAELDAIEKFDPLFSQIYTKRADILGGMGKIVEAKAAYETALKIRPDDPRIMEQYAALLSLNGDPEGAMEIWKRLAKVNPQDPEIKERVAKFAANTDYAQGFMFDAEKLAAESKASGDPNVNSQILVDQYVIKIAKSGLGSERRQLIVRILTEEGKKRWQYVFTTFQGSRQEVKAKVTRILRPGEGEISPLPTRSMPYGSSEKMVYDVWYFAVTLNQLKVGDVFEVQLETNDLSADNLFSGYFGDLQLPYRDAPVDLYKYTLIAPSGKTIYYNKPKFCPEPLKKEKDGDVYYTWEGKNLARIIPEPLMSGPTETNDPLIISTLKDKDAFHEWFKKLSKDQFTVGPRIKKKTAELIAGAVEPMDKLKKIFRFVADDIKYIALELGVHSYKPYQANDVFERGYGDCKDKATLLVAMLKEAGIAGEMVILRTRDMGNVDPTPPSIALFNHAIAYVPQFGLYLDATVEHDSAEFLPWVDQGATAFIMKESTAELVSIPYKPPKSDYIKLGGEIKLEADGRTLYSEKSEYYGVYAYNWRYELQDKSQRQKTLERILNSYSPGIKLIKFDVQGVEEPEKPVFISYEAELTNYSKQSGDKTLLPLDLSTPKNVSTYASLSQRGSPITLRLLACETGTRSFTVTKGKSFFSIPKPYEIKTKFGAYKLTCAQLTDKPETVECDYEKCIAKTKIEVGEYQEFRDYMQSIDSAENQSLEVIDVK